MTAPERELRLSLAWEQTKHLTPEEKVRLCALLAESVAKADPCLPLPVFELVSWASVRLGAAVERLDAMEERRAEWTEADLHSGDGE